MAQIDFSDPFLYERVSPCAYRVSLDGNDLGEVYWVFAQKHLNMTGASPGCGARHWFAVPNDGKDSGPYSRRWEAARRGLAIPQGIWPEFPYR